MMKVLVIVVLRRWSASSQRHWATCPSIPRSSISRLRKWPPEKPSGKCGAPFSQFTAQLLPSSSLWEYPQRIQESSTKSFFGKPLMLPQRRISIGILACTIWSLRKVYVCVVPTEEKDGVTAADGPTLQKQFQAGALCNQGNIYACLQLAAESCWSQVLGGPLLHLTSLWSYHFKYRWFSQWGDIRSKRKPILGMFEHILHQLMKWYIW